MKTLRAVQELLERVGEDHWARWMRRCADQLDQSQISGAERLLGAYGGMGSFNDLRIAQFNGHAVEKTQEAEVNAKLEDLRERAYLLAHGLKREAERT